MKLLSAPLSKTNNNMGAVPTKSHYVMGALVFFWPADGQGLDFTGLPPVEGGILHCTLLPLAAGQWKFALSGLQPPGKVQNGPECRFNGL